MRHKFNTFRVPRKCYFPVKFVISLIIFCHDGDNAAVCPPVDFCISPIATTVPEAVVSPPKTVPEGKSIPGIRYPPIREGMTANDFKSWTMVQLQDFLADRCINKSGTKGKLVENAYGAYKMNLPVTATDAQSELLQLKQDISKKLVLENGMVNLPNPSSLKDEWVLAPLNIPDTTHEIVMHYLVTNDAGKAYRGGKSLLESGHVSNVMTHLISPNIRYCFVRGLCLPEQKLSNNPYDVWICIQKDTGDIITGDCSCTAGYVCNIFKFFLSFRSFSFLTNFA